MNSILNIYKPSGISSAKILNQLKRVIEEKKIGHTGTLDPLAEGVLPVFTGKMTKLIPFFNVTDKSYFVTAKLGFSSPTYDSEGEVSPVKMPSNSPQLITQTLKSFIGTIDQIPPMYSAISVQGKRLYEYAREGIVMERKARRITIYDITNICIHFPYVSFHVHCSKGTYIRSLVHDLGTSLQSDAIITKLIRTSAGSFFTLQNTIFLDQVKKIKENRILFHSVNEIFPSWIHLSLESKEQEINLKNGQPLFFKKQNIHCQLLENKAYHAYILGINKQLYAIGFLAFSPDNHFVFTPKKVCI